MPNYDQLQSKKSELIRKALDGSAFAGPSSAPAIESITGPTGELLVLPDGWDDTGYLTQDGMAHTRDVTSSDITSFGRQTPTRSDITADTTTITFAAQETKLRTIEMATGSVLTDYVPREGGEVVIRKPQRPSARTYRLLTMAVDLSEDGEIYIARFFPKAKVTGFSDQPYATGDQAILWGVTMTAQMDDELGFSEAWHFGGPGWEALLTEMGFQTPAS